MENVVNIVVTTGCSWLFLTSGCRVMRLEAAKYLQLEDSASADNTNCTVLAPDCPDNECLHHGQAFSASASAGTVLFHATGSPVVVSLIRHVSPQAQILARASNLKNGGSLPRHAKHRPLSSSSFQTGLEATVVQGLQTVQNPCPPKRSLTLMGCCAAFWRNTKKRKTDGISL